MPFLRRLGYYLVGLSIGLVFLSFFLSGKRTSCHYGPEARVKNNFEQKTLTISSKVKNEYEYLNDSLLIEYIKTSTIIFSESQTRLDSCKRYRLRREKAPKLDFLLENCEKELRLIEFNAR